MDELVMRYQSSVREDYMRYYYENGFDHLPSPVISQQRPKEFQMMSWGLIPWWVKSKAEADQIRVRTLNAISEEAFEKPAFRDSIQNSRCLVPCTGFFEWRWFKGGKIKYPYFIYLPSEPIFSLAGVCSEWTDKQTGEVLQTYAVLTTRANSLMEKIHNSKLRMPVILPREFERDWLNPNLTKDDVLAFCQPYDAAKMKAHTISKMITDRKMEDKNIPAISKPFEYPELALLDA